MESAGHGAKPRLCPPYGTPVGWHRLEQRRRL